MIPLIINGQNTDYFITEQGEIYSNKTNKFLKGTIRSGYRMVKLTINKQKKDYCVHRLVAETFLSNPENLPQVNHKDRNKLNNCVKNLEWVTGSQNMIHVQETGKAQRQKIIPIDEEISENTGWKQFKDTNYWFNKDGRGANIKTKKYLNSYKAPDGYLRYYLYIDKKRIVYLAHRLIYEVFSSDKLNTEDQINHLDGNKENNFYNNLEKVSRKENVQHSFYVLKKNIKPVIQYDKFGNFICEFPSISEAARSLNIQNSGIVRACKGKLKTFHGYIWKYKEI